MKNLHIACIFLFSATAVSAIPSKVIRHPATGVQGEYMVVLDSAIPSEAVEGVALLSQNLTLWISSMSGDTRFVDF
ncbi:MAG: hypothetical protein KY459_01470 [Acidobacteria bacterium]|nr:hypothetical protein [Acidobacteriota bacterium]